MIKRTSQQHKGFTLIETLVSVSLLMIAVTAPLSLASFSLSSSYYARDEITAFHLAQEALEAVRNVRDGNILSTVALGTPVDLMTGIPSTTGEPFTVDTSKLPIAFALCSGDCVPLAHNGEFYGYGPAPTWVETPFTRTVRVTAISADEFRVDVELTWKTSIVNQRTFTISENLYRWVNDGS